MRSGPATRTACCRMNFTLTLRHRKGLPNPCPGPASPSAPHDGGPFESDPELQITRAPEDAPRLIASTGRSLARRDRSLRRPQRPGCPHAFTFGNRSAAYPSGFPSTQALQLAPTSAFWKTTAEPGFAITGSVSFTPAVIAMSRIREGSAIGIHGRAVRKLWSVEIPCGRMRKTRQKLTLFPSETPQSAADDRMQSARFGCGVNGSSSVKAVCRSKNDLNAAAAKSPDRCAYNA